MIQPRSIRRKLQGWVVVVFLLTGTAGWSGIWGLWYLSGESKALATTDVSRVEKLVALQKRVGEARRGELALRVAIASIRPPAPVETAEDGTPIPQPAAPTLLPEATRLSDAWLMVDPALKELASTPDGEQLTRQHGEVATALAGLVAAARMGKPTAEAWRAPIADYEAKATALEARTDELAAASFAAIGVRTDKVADGMSLLQAILFATVLVCQLFSAWAGWELARTLAAQLGELKESAERISMGDLKSEVKIEGADVEVHEVGEALDRLRVSLAKAMERLAGKRKEAHPAPAPEA